MIRRARSTRRLILRPIRLADYSRWYDAYVNRLPPRNKWDRGPFDPKQCTKKRFREIISRHAELAKSDKVYIYGIFEKKTGALVGAIDIAIFFREDRQHANLGWQLFNRHWGNGYAREAVSAAIRMAFEDLKLHRLEAAINLGNTRSLKLARATGMTYEGIKRKYLFEGGEWIDHHVFTVVNGG